MHKEAREELRVRFKLLVIELAAHFGAPKACKEFNVPRSSFYRWKQKYENGGREGLYRQKPVAYSHPRKPSSAVVEKIVALRTDYQLGALRIKYYMERYHGIKLSESTVTRVLGACGMSRLPRTDPRRALHTKLMPKRYQGTKFT